MKLRHPNHPTWQYQFVLSFNDRNRYTCIPANIFHIFSWFKIFQLYTFIYNLTQKKAKVKCLWTLTSFFITYMNSFVEKSKINLFCACQKRQSEMFMNFHLLLFIFYYYLCSVVIGLAWRIYISRLETANSISRGHPYTSTISSLGSIIFQTVSSYIYKT